MFVVIVCGVCVCVGGGGGGVAVCIGASVEERGCNGVCV